MVYDLFGVVNHMGGMTGGHYTACCRSSPCSKDGVEEVTGWGLEHPWLHFDDEFVEVNGMHLVFSSLSFVAVCRMLPMAWTGLRRLTAITQIRSFRGETTPLGGTS